MNPKLQGGCPGNLKKNPIRRRFFLIMASLIVNQPSVQSEGVRGGGSVTGDWCHMT